MAISAEFENEQKRKTSIFTFMMHRTLSHQHQVTNSRDVMHGEMNHTLTRSIFIPGMASDWTDIAIEHEFLGHFCEFRIAKICKLSECDFMVYLVIVR